jgi:hypothetical protein
MPRTRAEQVLLKCLRDSEKEQRKAHRRAVLQQLWTEITDGTLLKLIGLMTIMTLLGLTLSHFGLSSNYGRYTADAYDWMER